MLAAQRRTLADGNLIRQNPFQSDGCQTALQGGDVNGPAPRLGQHLQLDGMHARLQDRDVFHAVHKPGAQWNPRSGWNRTLHAGFDP